MNNASAVLLISTNTYQVASNLKSGAIPGSVGEKIYIRLEWVFESIWFLWTWYDC